MFSEDKSQNTLLVKKSDVNNDFVTIGTIKDPFGINGLVKVKMFSKDPKILKSTNDFFVRQNRLLTKINLKTHIGKNIWVARFSSIYSREEILKHKGLGILYNKDLLPVLGPNEYYYFDLIGLNIKIKQDGRKGFVKDVVNYGSGDLLEVKLGEIDQTYLIPFNEENVIEINLLMKKIILTPQKGLLPKNLINC